MVVVVDLREGIKIVFKKLFHHSQLGAPQKEKNPGALGTCPMCPLVKTALITHSHGSVVRATMNNNNTPNGTWIGSSVLQAQGRDRQTDRPRGYNRNNRTHFMLCPAIRPNIFYHTLSVIRWQLQTRWQHR